MFRKRKENDLKQRTDSKLIIKEAKGVNEIIKLVKQEPQDLVIIRSKDRVQRKDFFVGVSQTNL